MTAGLQRSPPQQGSPQFRQPQAETVRHGNRTASSIVGTLTSAVLQAHRPPACADPCRRTRIQLAGPATLGCRVLSRNAGAYAGHILNSFMASIAAASPADQPAEDTGAYPRSWKRCCRVTTMDYAARITVYAWAGNLCPQTTVR